MAPPSQPYVDIKSGACIPGGFSIPPGGNFSWYNSNPAGGPNCSVTATWCSTPPTPLAPQASWQATVGNVRDGFYNWSSPCCQSAAPVHVKGVGHGGGHHEKE